MPGARIIEWVADRLAGAFCKDLDKDVANALNKAFEENVARDLAQTGARDAADAALKDTADSTLKTTIDDTLKDAPGQATTLDGSRYAIGRDGGPPAARPGDFGLPKDAPADSPIGPYAPAGPADDVKGLSTFKSPEQLAPNATGPVWELPDGTPLPEGSAILDDGSEVGGNMPEGHSTIYPSQQTTLSDFQNANKGYGWNQIGRIRELKDGTRIFVPKP